MSNIYIQKQIVNTSGFMYNEMKRLYRDFLFLFLLIIHYLEPFEDIVYFMN